MACLGYITGHRIILLIRDSRGEENERKAHPVDWIKCLFLNFVT